MAAINGPIEVQRRDELPEEAAVDVTIRPASGVGGKSCMGDKAGGCLINIKIKECAKDTSKVPFKTHYAMSYWSQHIHVL